MTSYQYFISIETISNTQKVAKDFAERNNWRDILNIDKFDHLREELLRMSQHLRYNSKDERVELVKNNPETFYGGISDLFFALCKLGVDSESAFNQVKTEIIVNCGHQDAEDNQVKKF